MPVTVAVDVMSGDADCAARVAACKRLKREINDVHIILVGDLEVINRHLNGTTGIFDIDATSDIVNMDDLPARAIRKRNSSMRRALELVADGKAHAAVSAGNTGALMGLGVVVLKVIEGIERPAIASFVPNRNATDFCCLLDLGANVECTPQMLRDFALMGTALMQATKKGDIPTVGLLNIGEESFKGGKLYQEAAALFKENEHINFIGNVEGYDIYRGGVDVIVCDGFTGNVALKVSEGLSGMLSGMLRDAFLENHISKFCGFLASPVLKKLKRRLDPRLYNGASLLGLRGVVVKSHGNADEEAFVAALRYAISAARRNVPFIISNTAKNIH